MKNLLVLFIGLQIFIAHLAIAQVDDKKIFTARASQTEAKTNIDKALLDKTKSESSETSNSLNSILKKLDTEVVEMDSISESPESVQSAGLGRLSISGFLDTYYVTNFNNPASRDNMGVSGVGRGFDRKVDQFSIGMVQTMFTYKTQKSEAVFDLAFGPNAQYGNYGSVPTAFPAYGYQFGKDDLFSALIIKQAYFNYNATDKLSFTLGQFGTHIGYEYIDAPLNFFYSINHTFNSGIPFYHTGLKSTYKFSENFSLMLGVVNGFDYVQDNNRAKGLISQISLKPTQNLSVFFNYINTNESTADELGKTPKGMFQVFDLNGGYQVNEKFNIGYWFMLGMQKGTLGSPGTFIPADGDLINTKSWYGANLYFTYSLSDLIVLGLRAEHFNNEDGARGLRNFDNVRNTYIGTTVNSLTFTTNIDLIDGHLLLKPEFRIDAFGKLDDRGYESGSQQFMDKNGAFTKNSQSTFGVAAVYKF